MAQNFLHWEPKSAREIYFLDTHTHTHINSVLHGDQDTLPNMILGHTIKKKERKQEAVALVLIIHGKFWLKITTHGRQGSVKRVSAIEVHRVWTRTGRREKGDVVKHLGRGAFFSDPLHFPPSNMYDIMNCSVILLQAVCQYSLEVWIVVRAKEIKQEALSSDQNTRT